MAALSAVQTSAVERLMSGAPDGLLMRLNAALSAARAADPLFAPVAEIARAEAEDRRIRDLVLAPLKPLTDPEPPPPAAPLLSAASFRSLWRAARALAPGEALAAETAAARLRPAAARDDPPPPSFDRLALALADALAARMEAGEDVPLAAGEARRAIELLRLAPVLRAVDPKLAGWARNPSGETAAAVRVAFSDAADAVDDGGRLFMLALQLRLEEPAHVMRLISAVMDRPSDRYLAASELADIGEALLGDVDRRLQRLRAFDPGRGGEGGSAEAASLLAASNILREFEEGLTMNREGPWGARAAAQKQALAQAAEARMREAEPALAAALPLHAQRMLGSLAPRPAPRIEGFPDDHLARRAEGLLTFVEESRSAAPAVGFGALRARTLEALEKRLDAYVEDLVERLRNEDRADGVEPDWARAHLEIAADFLGLIKGPDAARIVRRRAAAA